MDCIVHEVAKSQTRLSDFHFTLGARLTEQDVSFTEGAPKEETVL